MVAEVNSLTVALDDQFSQAANAAGQAADALAAGLDKVAGSSQTVDVALRTRGQTIDSINKRTADQAALTERLTVIEEKYQAAVRLANADVSKTATDTAEQIRRLGVLRDEDLQKATGSFDKLNQKFAASQQAGTQSAQAAADAVRTSFSALDGLIGKYDAVYAATQRTASARQDMLGLLNSNTLSLSQYDTLTAALGKVEQGYRGILSAAEAAAQAQRDAASAQGQSIANQFAGVKPQNIIQDDTDYKARAADIAAYGKALDAARASINPLFAAQQQYEARLKEIDAAVATGAAAEDEATAARVRAKASYDSTTEVIKKSDELSQNLGTSSRNLATQTRLLGVQAIQTFSGLATGQPILTTLIQQIHQVFDSMLATGSGMAVFRSAFEKIVSPIGLMVTGTVAATAALYEFTKAGETSLATLASTQQAVRGNHDDFEALGQTVVDVARKVSQSGGLGLDEAVQAAKTIASSKYFAGTGQDLERLTRDAEDLAGTFGSVAAASKFVTDALADPSKAAESVADKFAKTLTPAILQEIDAMKRSGDQNGAAVKLLSTLENAAGGAARGGLGPIAKAWQDLGNAFSSSTSGWRPFTEWLATEFAAAIGHVTSLVNAFKDAWNGLTSIPSVARSLTSQGATNLAGALGTGDGPQLTGGQASLPSGQIPAALTSSATKDAFVAQWLDAAKQAGSQLGVSPQVLLGQWGLETGWGRSAYNNNLGNIKPGFNYGGQTFVNPGDNTAYRSYATPQDFAADYARLIQSRYQAAVGTGSNATAFGQALKAGGYAEDPNYVSKLTATASSLQLPGNIASNTAAATDAMKKYVDQSRALKDLQLDTEWQNMSNQLVLLAQTTGSDTTEFKALQQQMEANRAERYKNIDASAAAQRQTESGLESTKGLTAADQALSAAMEARRQVALQSRGEELRDDEAAQVRTNVLAAQTQEYDRLTHELTESTANQATMASAYGQGNKAIGEATAMQAAYTSAIKIFGQNIPAGKFQELIGFYTKLAQTTADAKTAQQNAGLQDNLAYIQAETSSLGENENARTRQLAVLKATQDQLREHNGVLTDEAQKYIALTGTIADATAAYQLQQNSLTEIKNFFSNTFDTIGTAITQAFATGNLAALKFKDIAHSVASAVASEFAKLAILNPLKNFLFGSNDVTLGSVGGVLGNLFGGGGSSNSGLPAGEVNLTSTASGVSALEGLGLVSSLSGSSASSLASANNASTSSSGGLGGLLQAGGVVSTLAKGVDYLSGGHLVSDLTNGFKEAIGFSSGQTLGSYVSSLIGEEVGGVAAGSTGSLGGAAFSATEGAGGASFAAGEAGAAAAGGEAGVGVIGSAVSTIAQALPYIGVAVSIISDLASGNFRGAGFVAGGAAVGAVVGTAIPVIGTAIGAAAGAVIGGLVDTFFPAHPLHPFDATAVNAQGGQLAVGKTATQATAATSLTEAQSFVDNVNTFMSKAGIVLANADGQLGAIGKGIAGMVGLVTDPNELIKTLNFKNNPNDTSQFGVAKGALEGMSFPTAQALSDELAKIAGFADATAAIGVRLRSVGQDLTNIQVANVEGGNAGATATTTGANGESVQYLNDLRTALNTDLPQKTYANVQALDDEINKVNQFVNGTIPGLLHPVEQTTSSIVDQANKVAQTYQDAINQSLAYGLDNTRALQDAAAEALAIVRKSGIDQIETNNTQIDSRLKAAVEGGAAVAAQAALENFDTQAQQQRDAFSKLMTDTYGDVVKTWDGYGQEMTRLETTLGAERVAAAKAAAAQLAAVYQGVADTEDSVTAQFYTATGRGLEGALLAQDVKARDETAAFVKTWTDAFGDAITQGADFQDRLAQLQATQGLAKQAIINQFASQPVDPTQQKFQSVVDTVEALGARDFAAQGDQKDADLINFDIKARQEKATFVASFVDLYGPAITQNGIYQAQLATLERVQGEERLAIIKKYGDAITGATAEQIKSAQASVSSLFTSLGDYVNKLQTGSDSPLSPTSQHDLALSQFNAVAGAAAAGDATSASKLTGYADSLLSTSRGMYGSGAQYAADFSSVLDAIRNVVQAPTDALTQSFLTLQLQQQTTSITQAQQATTDAINAMRRELMAQTRTLTQLAA